MGWEGGVGKRGVEGMVVETRGKKREEGRN
jgi:hypothetical protein